jgi:hypothetical protein
LTVCSSFWWPEAARSRNKHGQNEAYVILHRGARSRGYKRREGARARARERAPLSTCLCLHVPLRPSQREPLSRKALDIPFYRCKEMSSGTMGCCYALRGWRGSALSPVHELTWRSGKCLEPFRSTAVGVAWILLTLSCFHRGLRAIRRHGCTWGAIITCYRSNLRWDVGPVPS